MHTATSGEEALSILNDLKPDLVIMDVRMPKMECLEVLEKIKEYHPRIQVIMMTAYSTTEKAIQAIKLGAYDYLTKPFDNDELLIRVRDAIKTKELMDEVVTFDVSDDYDGRERIIGKCPAMLNIYKQIGKVAPTDAAVLIRGESGTGKELITRNSEVVIGVAVAAFPGHPLVYLAIILGPVIELPMLLLIPRVMLGIKDHIWVGILNEDCMRRSNDDN